jgi:galactofuranose transport system ATP-binding protein
MTDELLSMAGIEKAFGGVAALSGASLSIKAAEIMGLIGQNGAGKSTMIKILNGAHGRDQGTISFGGQEWTATSPQAAQRAGVSTIFQELNLIPFRSVTENIALRAF